MNAAPPLVDRTALSLRRARANTGAHFLNSAAMDEVQDRLEMVNRTFLEPAVVTPFPDQWRQIFPKARIVPDDDVLALDVGAHDLVVHGFCLHWANDPVGQIIQCRRALREDGLFLSVSLGGQTLSELRVALSEAEIGVRGGLSPRVLPMADIRDSGALLQRAGLALPVADGNTINAEYRDIYHLMRDLRAMGETNALSSRVRHATPKALFERANDIYRANFAGEEGRIRARFEFVTLTGWAPSDSQPKPLRPGSAIERLSDALNTKETKLID